MRWSLYVLIGLLALLAACTADVGEMCGGFNGACVTGNCVNSTCLKSPIGGACKEDYQCGKGVCILDQCRSQSDIGGFCETDNHCVKGVCKEYTCQLGEKGDSCVTNDDCDQANYECLDSQCVSNAWYCQVGRFLGLSQGSFLMALILLVIGVVGIIFGVHLMGGNVVVGGITLSFSIFVVVAALAVFGVGFAAACY
jgi:hypothetical protein